MEYGQKKKREKGKRWYKKEYTQIWDRGTQTPLNMWGEHGHYSVNDQPTLSLGDRNPS